ncbi:hypothetical protein Vadar_000246 [Vaccinium darrowii]|uniref:Uncharacterized protein n=1 Tax=Vaccinium darrowii TaxID=229202 RepID=A0ACB7X751_9ERIC|nr:hypothetical protein Vadar_000246 [Vaccinium darrowii]
MVETRNGTHTNPNNGGPQNAQSNNQTSGHANGQTSNIGNGVSDLTQLLQAIAAAAANLVPQPNQRAPLRHQMNKSQMLDFFCKRQPPIFYGEPDPATAEAWLKQITKLLEVLNVEDAGDRIALASFQLQGEADPWRATSRSTVLSLSDPEALDIVVRTKIKSNQLGWVINKEARINHVSIGISNNLANSKTMDQINQLQARCLHYRELKRSMTQQ